LKFIATFIKILNQNMPQIKVAKIPMAQLGCGKNWSNNHFSFENFEFRDIQI